MTTILQQDLRDTFGFTELSPAEQEVFLEKLGTTVIDAALVSLVTELNEEQQASLNYYLDTEPNPEALLEHLLTQYESFEQILEQTIKELKEDVVSVLGEEKKIRQAERESLAADVQETLPADE